VRTYGILEFNGTLWRVRDLTPPCAMMFKRLFPRVQSGGVSHLMADSLQLRADLDWFLDRWPLQTKHRDKLKAGVMDMRDQEELIDGILGEGWKPSGASGFREGQEPWTYQSQAAAITLETGRLLLGDDVGLGKTISAFATMCMGAPDALPAAVVVQPHLAKQWQDRLEEFTDLTSEVIETVKPDLKRTVPDVTIFRYSNVAGWSDTFAGAGYRSVFWDEMQELRHGTGTAKGSASAVLADMCQYRMGLTATPIYNYGSEIWNVMQYLDPGILGTWEEFLREWCIGGRIVQNPDALGEYLRECNAMLRRTEHDVDKAMPPPNVVMQAVPWDDRVFHENSAHVNELANLVLNGSFHESGQAARELDAKMRQATGVAKSRAVAAYCRMLLEEGGVKKLILAGWHREVWDIWQEVLSDFDPAMYTGSETTKKKNQNIDRFCKGDARILMLSLRSGAGVDGLERYCDDVVVGEFDWSPQVHKQIIGRVRRGGKSRQVNVYYPYVEEGSDPVLMEVNGIKADQARGINDPGKALPEQQRDESRVKMLAQAVLSREEANVKPGTVIH